MRSYWLLLAALMVLTVSLPTLAHWRQYLGSIGGFLSGTGSFFPAMPAERLKTGLFILLLVTPGIQLVCSVVMAIWVEVRSGYNPEEKSASRRTIGKITAWSFLGAVLGLVVMVILFQATKRN